MTDRLNDKNVISIADEFSDQELPEWDDLIVCRVEVDLPTWMAKLTDGGQWEVYSESEEENCISFALRESAEKAKKVSQPKLAEVTLYHNGYAVVDVEGQSLFDGSLTNGESDFAHLTYFNADSGEEILLH